MMAFRRATDRAYHLANGPLGLVKSAQIRNLPEKTAEALSGQSPRDTDRFIRLRDREKNMTISGATQAAQRRTTPQTKLRASLWN